VFPVWYSSVLGYLPLLSRQPDPVEAAPKDNGAGQQCDQARAAEDNVEHIYGVVPQKPVVILPGNSTRHMSTGALLCTRLAAVPQVVISMHVGP
jgi:hypothetical protein